MLIPEFEWSDSGDTEAGTICGTDEVLLNLSASPYEMDVGKQGM